MVQHLRHEFLDPPRVTRILEGAIACSAAAGTHFPVGEELDDTLQWEGGNVQLSLDDRDDKE
jgi:hypothetical protein